MWLFKMYFFSSISAVIYCLWKPSHISPQQLWFLLRNEITHHKLVAPSFIVQPGFHQHYMHIELVLFARIYYLGMCIHQDVTCLLDEFWIYYWWTSQLWIEITIKKEIYWIYLMIMFYKNEIPPNSMYIVINNN